jgi:hypothetical protein
LAELSKAYFSNSSWPPDKGGLTKDQTPLEWVL